MIPGINTADVIISSINFKLYATHMEMNFVVGNRHAQYAAIKLNIIACLLCLT
jgi:hypothetical protein